MRKNWMVKGYDQSVTCLADDPRNLETPNNTLRTPGILSQANYNIHKYQATMHKQNSNKISNQKVQLKNSGWQKESNRRSNENQPAKETSFVY